MAQFRQDRPTVSDIADMKTLNYVFRLVENLEYVLQNIGKDNFSSGVWEQLSSASDSIKKGDFLSAETKLNDISGVLSVSKGGTGVKALPANRVLIGGEQLQSIDFPFTSGSVLCQDDSGAPYWDDLPTLMSSWCVATYSSPQAIGTSDTKLKFEKFWTKNDPLNIFSTSTYGVTVSRSGIYAVSLYADLIDAKSGIVFLSRNGGAINVHNVFNNVQDVFFPEIFMNFSAGEVIGFTAHASPSPTTVVADIFGLRMNIKYMGK